MEIAKVNAKSLPISTKHAVEVCRFIRNKPLHKAKKLLEGVIQKKVAVPFKRYNRDIAHKPGIASGRYPKKTASIILKLLNNLEKNAQYIGLDTSRLFISLAKADKASKHLKAGRRYGRFLKRTHITLEAMEKQERIEEKKEKND